MHTAKIYDYNGPIVDIEPFWDFLREQHPDLYHQYRIVGAEDKEVKEATKPIVVELYEKAINEGLFPAKLMPYVEDRLESDFEEGYYPFIFTSVPRDTVCKQLKETGINGFFGSEQIVTLDDVIAQGGLSPTTTKEDPLAFGELIKRLSEYFNLTTYVDDSAKRVLAAHEANQSFPETKRIGRLYVFDPKGKTEANPAYSVVDSLMSVE